jgi:hypothetical protein
MAAATAATIGTLGACIPASDRLPRFEGDTAIPITGAASSLETQDLENRARRDLQGPQTRSGLRELTDVHPPLVAIMALLTLAFARIRTRGDACGHPLGAPGSQRRSSRAAVADDKICPSASAAVRSEPGTKCA